MIGGTELSTDAFATAGRPVSADPNETEHHLARRLDTVPPLTRHLRRARARSSTSYGHIVKCHSSCERVQDHLKREGKLPVFQIEPVQYTDSGDANRTHVAEIVTVANENRNSEQAVADALVPPPLRVTHTEGDVGGRTDPCKQVTDATDLVFVASVEDEDVAGEA